MCSVTMGYSLNSREGTYGILFKDAIASHASTEPNVLTEEQWEQHRQEAMDAVLAQPHIPQDIPPPMGAMIYVPPPYAPINPSCIGGGGAPVAPGRDDVMVKKEGNFSAAPEICLLQNGKSAVAWTASVSMVTANTILTILLILFHHGQHKS